MGQPRFPRTVDRWRLELQLNFGAHFYLSSSQVAKALWKFCTLRNVSFRHPNKEDFALRDLSFKIGKGQLCVSLMVSILISFGARLIFGC